MHVRHEHMVAFGAYGDYVWRMSNHSTACSTTASGMDPIHGVAKARDLAGKLVSPASVEASCASWSTTSGPAGVGLDVCVGFAWRDGTLTRPRWRPYVPAAGGAAALAASWPGGLSRST